MGLLNCLLYDKDRHQITNTMKAFIFLCLVAAAMAEADPQFLYGNYGYNTYSGLHYGGAYSPYTYGYNSFHYGKREAEADPALIYSSGYHYPTVYADFPTESTTPTTPPPTPTASTTTARGMPSPRPTPLSSTAASTTPPPTAMASTTTATAVFTTTASTAESTPTASARPRLSPGGPTMVATLDMAAMAATGATGDGIKRRTDAWTTDFDNDIK